MGSSAPAYGGAADDRDVRRTEGVGLMPHFKRVDVWAPTGPPDHPEHDDYDADEDAFVRTSHSVLELYSEGLAPLGLQGPRSELCLFVGHDPNVTQVEVRVFTDRPAGSEAARVELPTGMAQLSAGARQQLVLEVVHGAVVRLARARGWDPDQLDAARRHVIDADFEFRWAGPWKTSPDRRHRARARYRLPHSGYGRAWLEVATRGGDVAAESREALAFNTLEGFKGSARTLRWDGSSAVYLIPYDGPFRAAMHGLVRLELREAGWASFVDDGMNAGSMAAELSANPPTEGSGERPPVVVRAGGAHEEESPIRIRVLGGGPTNDVPDAYLDRIHELLHVLAGPEGQEWWLDAGIKELWFRYDLAEEKPRIRTRLHRNILSATIQRNAPGLTYVPDPGAIAARDVEKLVTAVRKRTGLGPHPLLPG